jgi:hypothetical protein
MKIKNLYIEIKIKIMKNFTQFIKESAKIKGDINDLNEESNWIVYDKKTSEILSAWELLEDAFEDGLKPLWLELFEEEQVEEYELSDEFDDIVYDFYNDYGYGKDEDEDFDSDVIDNLSDFISENFPLLDEITIKHRSEL